MVCVSCGRTGDPNRSFCTNCGSAVFVDTRKSMRTSMVMAPTSSEVPDSHGLSSGARSGMPKVAATSFPLVGLVKLLVFGYIVWWIGSALLAVPEVRTMWEQLQRGETVNVDPAVNRLKGALGPAESTPSPAPEAPREPAPAVPPTAEATTSALAPGVFLPGNGVTTPRATERHLPSYTRQARISKIEGVVRLKGIVQPDGSITGITVVTSLDSQYGLDEAAISALEQWRFEPGTRNGVPVPVQVFVDLTFKLR